MSKPERVTLKLVRVVPTLEPSHGGPVTTLRDVVPVLRDAGIAQAIIHPRPRSSEGRTVQRELAGSAVMLEVPTKFAYGFAYAVRSQIERLIRTCDVLHIDGVYNYLGWRAYRIAVALGIPYVVQPHGALTDYHWTKKRAKKALHERLVERPMLHGSVRVLVDSDRERRQLVSRFTCDAEIFPRPISIGDIRRTSRDNGNELIVGTLCRLAEKKNIELLISAFADAQRSSNRRCQLRIAGPGDKTYVDWLRRCAAAEGVADDVTIIGPQYGKEKWSFLSSLDVFCLPSSDESFGIVIIEAALAGALVIASENCGAAESFDETQIVVVQATVTDVSHAIQGASINPSSRLIMSASGREAAASLFTGAGVANRLSATYLRVAQGDDYSRTRPSDNDTQVVR